MNLKTLNVSAMCSKCNITVDLSQDSVTLCKPYKDSNGQSIFLTYFDCPECKERHFVQVDNAHTNDVKDKLTKQFIRLSVMRNNGTQIPSRQRNKLRTLQNTLRFSRNQLMKFYDGKVVTDTETGKEVNLRFVII